MILGVISDTHGLLRPEALAALAGVDRILHAGDVGAPEVLDLLGRIAPVEVVRGNVDQGAWAELLPATTTVEIEGKFLYLLHDLGQLDLDPRAAGLSAVVYGHSHKPKVETHDGVLYLNPGSAGPRRFHLPVAVARLDVRPGGAGLDAEILHLRV